jgi:glycosyltransferase involved in cell wall biosynthesis
MILTLLISVIFIILIVISLYNLFTAPALAKSPSPSFPPEVSILIPARNESDNIITTVEAALNQNYLSFNVVVLDDNSDDDTYSKLSILSEKHSKLRVIKGLPLRAGWNGKNWACYQLFLNSTADYYLFMDADVRLSPDSLSSAINLLLSRKASMLSIFPTQIMYSLGERLVVPLMNLILLSFLPLKKIFTSPKVSLTAANGQFMLWEKSAYILTGTHLLVADEIVEDMALAKEAKNKGYKIITTLGGNSISCRMYNSFSSSLAGFTKNFFPGFNSNTVLFFLFNLLLLLIFIVPMFLLFYEIWIPFLMSLILRAIISFQSKQNIIFNTLLHPFQLLILFNLAIRSYIHVKKKKIKWKGRTITV